MTAEDHLGVMDFHFHRAQHGALQVEHSYKFHTTAHVLADATVQNVVEKWKVDGDQERQRFDDQNILKS